MERTGAKNVLLNIIVILNIVFPIISIEAFIPWILCILSIYLSIKSRERYGESIKIALIFLIANGAIVLLLNYLQTHGINALFI